MQTQALNYLKVSAGDGDVFEQDGLSIVHVIIWIVLTTPNAAEAIHLQKNEMVTDGENKYQSVKVIQ